MNLKVVANGAAHWLTKRCTGPFWYRRAWLSKTEWLDRGQLEEIQLKRLQRLVRHCYKTVPYYRQLMDREGLVPGCINTLDDIRKFPLLTKRAVLEAGDAIVSRKYPRRICSKGFTGGTTGTALRILRDPFSVGNEHAFVRRQWEWAGIKLSDATAYLSARRVVHADQHDGPLYAYDPFMKELILSNYHLSRESAPSFIRAMERHHVAALVGYPSAIHFLARLCSDLCMSPALKAVLTTSETISPGVRETIERAFGCQVFDFYGAAERVCYIFTCDHGRYHVQSEYGLTEFLPMTGEYAGTARIVATGFWNLATPLIRYDTQDLVETATGDCPCGRQSPLVKKISGRTGDLVITPSGKHFAPTLMSSVSRQGRNILQTQIIQDRIDHLLITYVPSSRFTSADLREFQANMRSSLPSELTLDFRSVTRVEATSSGKTNLVISRIKERADQ